MLEGLQAVLGVFQQEDGSYTVFRLPTEVYRTNMRLTPSRGASEGQVNRSVFEQHGTGLGVFRVS